MSTRPIVRAITDLTPTASDSHSEMAARVAALDWSRTPLGAMSSWPESLRVAVDVCLNNRFPMHVWWGPDLINIYNDGHIPLHGKRHPDALGQSARDVWKDAWTVLEPQVEAVMKRGESTWNERARVELERNGCTQEAWFTWCYSPIRDASGQIAGLMCVATEDTAQVLAERQRDKLEEQRQQQWAMEKALADEALRSSTTLLRGISDSTTDAIFAKDREGRLRFANPAVLALIGKPLEQVLGKTDAELLDNADAARIVMENDRRIIQSGIAEDLEEIVPLANGTHCVWFSTKMPYRDADGNVIGLLGISRDITERKKMEQEARRAREVAEAASKAKDHFLAVVSHELRTPLNPILAITSFLETRDDLPPDLREDMNTIRRNVQQEAKIVDDLLNLTRLNRGKIVLHQEALDVHALIGEVIDGFSSQMHAKGIELQRELTADHSIAWADPSRMRQVLANLLDNAIKFTPEQGRITVRSSTTTSQRLRIEIVDNGVGIEPDVLPRLFNSFEQGEKTITRRFGGLGLGLVIVKGIIDLHGGTITATSDGHDKGTRFAVELGAMYPTLAALPPDTISAPEEPRTSRRILLVEDHGDTLRVMCRVLKSMGYAVITATTFKEAVAKINDESFDLLLSDIGLPDGSGLDIMRLLRERKDIAGIAVSGFGLEEDIRRSKEAGFVEHLIKPVDFQLLDSALRRIAG